MPYAGRQLQPEELAERLHALGFRDLDLVEMTATILGESRGYTEAWNDNTSGTPTSVKRGDKVLLLGQVGTVTAVSKTSVTASGITASRASVLKVLSRDVGLGQINIPARDIGTSRERKLHDLDYNLQQVRKLFLTRETLVKRRRFNPWYAFTTGWAIFPEWWVFRSKQAAEASNKPREWIPTGHYIQQAVVGVAKFYAQHYGITNPELTLCLPGGHHIDGRKPAKPPHGDGPRPKPNDGRGSLG